MSHTESPDFDLLATHREIAREARQDREEIARLRAAIEAIKKATIDGRVCNDVAWFDEITTLHDFCDQTLNAHRRTEQENAE